MAKLTPRVESFISTLLDVSGRARVADLSGIPDAERSPMLQAFIDAHPEMSLAFDGDLLSYAAPTAAMEPPAPAEYGVPAPEPLVPVEPAAQPVAAEPTRPDELPSWVFDEPAYPASPDPYPLAGLEAAPSVDSGEPVAVSTVPEVAQFDVPVDVVGGQPVAPVPTSIDPALLPAPQSPLDSVPVFDPMPMAPPPVNVVPPAVPQPGRSAFEPPAPVTMPAPAMPPLDLPAPAPLPSDMPAPAMPAPAMSAPAVPAPGMAAVAAPAFADVPAPDYASTAPTPAWAVADSAIGAPDYYPQSVPAQRKMPAYWYALALFFWPFGGVAGFFAMRRVDPKGARNLLLLTAAIGLFSCLAGVIAVILGAAGS